MGQLRHSLVDRQTASSRRDDRGRGELHMSARMRADEADAGFLVRVRNVSAGGLMAELPHPLPPDSAVEVKLTGIGWVAGRVVWQTEGRTGVAFDHPVDVSLVKDAGSGE
ncbi:PilZ domain-containing protein [Sphingomonas endophytica]|uniref:PilZ domain-containing protein n=1 Tax=Sphingomonas endophytica TaxID=869719 RepID=UPI0009F923A3|nr:PilZ domain-containing protein [Sphingomonas endophytica]